MNSKSKELSLKRATLKAAMAKGDVSKLMLPKLQAMPDGSVWIPLGLVAQRQPSQVRVTVKGVPKYERAQRKRYSVWKGVTKTPPDWWTSRKEQG